VTIAEVIALLQTLIQDATVVTQPTGPDPAPTVHAPCSGTGFIAGLRDVTCGGTGLNQLPSKVRIIATSGTVTATPIAVSA
jgi:hypothetical protein